MAANTLAGPISEPLPVADRTDELIGFNRRGLFVGGCATSGTTLLLSLLDGHPELAVFPRETHFLEEVHKYGAQSSDFTGKLKRLLRRLDPRLPDGLRCEESQFAAFSKRAADCSVRPGMTNSLFLPETVKAYLEATGSDWRECVRWVEKTPTNAAHADELFRLFPDAKLIHIVRDPRAVFASRRRRLVDQYGSYAKAHRLVREWNQSARQLRRLAHRSGSHLVLRYEDLVHDSSAVLRKICRFVGIGFRPMMLQPTLAGQPWPGNPTFCTGFNRIDKSPVNRWRTELTSDEIWWIELHCQEGMQLAGYQPETKPEFSLRRWARRLPGESWRGFLRARKSSFCQWAGLLEDCRYDSPAEPVNPVAAPPINVDATAEGS